MITTINMLSDTEKTHVAVKLNSASNNLHLGTERTLFLDISFYCISSGASGSGAMSIISTPSVLYTFSTTQRYAILGSHA